MFASLRKRFSNYRKCSISLQVLFFPLTPLSTAGFWTDIQRRRERFFLHLGHLHHGFFVGWARFASNFFSLISEIKRIWIHFTCVSLFHYKISLLFFRFFPLIFASNFSLRFTWVIFASKRNKAKRNSSLFFLFFSHFFRYFSHFFAFFRFFSL